MGKKMWLSLSALVLALVLMGVALLALSHTAPVQATVLHDSSDAATGSTVQTWTHTTRGDWEQGLIDRVDRGTISGSLQLMQQLVGESATISPPEDLASGQIPPSIAMDAAGNTYVVWEDGRNGDGDIYFAYRAAVSTTWSASVKINDDVGTTWQRSPDIAVDASGNAYAVWNDQRNGQYDVYFAYRPAGGTWGSNVRVTDNRGTARALSEHGAWGVTEHNPPVVVVDSAGNAYALWHDARNDEGDVYFAYRPAGGTWGLNLRVNDDAGTTVQHRPDIAVDAGGNVYAVWMDMRGGNEDIYFAYRNAISSTWSANTKVNDDTGTALQNRVRIAVDESGNAYAVWEDKRDEPDIYFAYRAAISTTWSANVKVDDDSSSYPHYPDIAVDASGNAHAVWNDYRNGHYDIYFASRAAISTTWGTNVKVSDDTGRAHQTNADIVMDVSGNPHLVWGDKRNGNPDVFYAARSVDGVWGVNERVDDDIAGRIWQRDPDIALDVSGNAYAVWMDARNGDWDIYFAYLAAVSTTWSTSVRVNDDVGTAPQEKPRVVVDTAGNAYAIWADGRNSAQNYDLYSAYLPAGGSWGANVQVNDVGDTLAEGYGVALDGAGNAYVVWGDRRNGDVDVYFAHRDAVSTTWSTNVKVSDDPGTANQLWVDVAADSAGNLYAVWSDERNGEREIYFAYRAAVSTTWSASVRVSDDPGTSDQGMPIIAVDGGGNAYAVWGDGRNGKSDIYFAYRPVGGPWGANTRINDNDDASLVLGADIAVDASGNAYAVWPAGRQGSYDVFGATRPAGGSWSINIRVDDDPYTRGQRHPAIEVDADGDLHVVWTDCPSSDWGGYIRYARSAATPEYAAQGSYTSPELDTGLTAVSWKSLTWQGDIPAETSLSFETRSRVAGQSWSAWQPSAGSIASPSGQYLQYRVTFSTALTDTTPRLDQVQVAYESAETPSAPNFATPCGVTNQTTPTLRGSAAAGTVVHLYVGGSEVATATADTDGAFTFTPGLTSGSHTLTATAENGSGSGPASTPLALVVSPMLAYDPIHVRAGQWSKDGWLMSAPRDAQECANPDNGWRIWPREDERLRVEVPVSYTSSAAVTVTVGTATIALTEESGGLFVGVLQPPIAGGDFVVEVNADGDVTAASGGTVLIDPDGYVYEAGGTISDTIAGVQVTCYYSDSHSGQWVMWDAWTYDQVNSQMTLEDGYYSFYTPPGTYRVVAQKEGYETYTSPDLVVVDAPIRHNIPLEQKKDRVLYLPLVLRSYP